jgi:hypothetical protein
MARGWHGRRARRWLHLTWRGIHTAAELARSASIACYRQSVRRSRVTTDGRRLDVALGGLRFDSSLVLALLAAGMLLGLLAPSPSASSFTIVQPTKKYAGKIYGQWSAAWWQWANSSEPNSPVTDATGADCAVKQKDRCGSVAGTW